MQRLSRSSSLARSGSLAGAPSGAGRLFAASLPPQLGLPAALPPPRAGAGEHHQAAFFAAEAAKAPPSRLLEGAMLVRGGSVVVPWLLQLPQGAQPPVFPLALLMTHGSKGDLSSAELPLYSAAAAEAGVPCLRYTFRCDDVAERARVMREVLLRSGEVHPSLAATPRWVLGGRSLGARTAVQLAAAAQGLPFTAAGAAGGPQEAAEAREAAAQLREAGRALAGLLLSAYPVHPLGEPERAYTQPVSSLRLPLLFARGTADPFSTPGPWEALRTGLASGDVEVAEIPGGDHLMRGPGGDAAQAPVREALRDALLAFLARLGAPSASKAPASEAGSEASGGSAASSMDVVDWQPEA